MQKSHVFLLDKLTRTFEDQLQFCAQKRSKQGLKLQLMRNNNTRY